MICGYFEKQRRNHDSAFLADHAGTEPDNVHVSCGTKSFATGYSRQDSLVGQVLECPGLLCRQRTGYRAILAGRQGQVEWRCLRWSFAFQPRGQRQLCLRRRDLLQTQASNCGCQGISVVDQ